MTEARPADLVYGHLGDAVYDTDSQEWKFTRRPYIGRQLKPIGQPTVAFKASLAQNLSSTTQSAVARTRTIKKLAKAYPELVPGIFLLPGLAQTSEIVCEATSRYDPTVSELLVFGTALNRDNPRTGSTTVPIVAAAGGEAGEAVRLSCVGKKRVGWHGNTTIGLTYSEIKDKEHGWWSGNGGPIQQLSFAEDGGNSSPWLAVRCPGATSILHPVLRPSTVLPVSPYPSLRAGLYQASRLDPNPVAVLPTEMTAGAPHADVSFNPWYEKQLAIVDQRGMWSVWDIEYKSKRRDLWTVKAGRVGSIQDGQIRGSDLSNIDTDGWGSILWAYNVHTLIVFGRRTFVLYNLKDDSEHLLGPDLALATGQDWILGVKRSPSDKCHVFVVTSSRIFWLRINGFGEVKEKENPDIGAEILLSWRHFRDPDDASLGLNILRDTEHTLAPPVIDSEIPEPKPALLVLLYSRLTGLTTVYTFQILPSPLDLPISASDPYFLGLSNPIDISEKPVIAPCLTQWKAISSLVLRDVEYNVRPGSTPSGPGLQYAKGNVRFYQLCTLFNDLSIEQSLYASTPAGRITLIHPPDFEVQIAPTKSAKIIKNSFIVPHGVSDGKRSYLHTDSSLVHEGERMMGEDSNSDDGDPWTVNFEWLERHIQSFTPSSLTLGRPTSPVVKSFSDLLDIMQSVIANDPIPEEPGIKLLVENLSMHNFVADVEQASKHLHDMTTLAAEGNDRLKQVYLDSCLIRSATEVGFVAGEELSLLQIYDSLIRCWITPLASSIPGRVRATIEKRLREVAVQIFLASYGIQSEPRPIQDENDPLTEQGLFTLPVRRKSKEREAPSRASLPQLFSQVSQDAGFTQSNPQAPPDIPPTPDPTPSLYSNSSASSLHPSEDPASQRLRTLASLTPQPFLPRSMQNILGHWTVGTNPDAYSWEAKQAALETEKSTEPEAQTKKRRKSEKQLKRKRQNTMPSSSQSVPTPSAQLVPPPIVSASQPPQAARATQASSQFSEDVAPVTQEERGVFGGRPRLKKMRIGGVGMMGRKKKPGF